MPGTSPTGAIARNSFGSSANALEAKVTPTPHHDATAGSNAGSAAHAFESRVVAQN
jgi:hypothetical protein